MAESVSARIDRLTEDARTLLCCLSTLEAPEREKSVAGCIWPSVWARAGREGTPPAFDDLLASLKEAALVEENPLVVEVGGGNGSLRSRHGGDALTQTRLEVETEVAEAARAIAPAIVLEASTKGAIHFWSSMVEAVAGADDVPDRDLALAQACLYVTPYLYREAAGQPISVFIERVLGAGDSPRVWSALVPLFQALAMLAGEGEGRLEALEQLTRALAMAGRDEEALRASAEAIDLARQAGNARSEASLLSAQASIEGRRGQFSAADSLVRQALKRAYATGDRALCCQLHLDLAAYADVAEKPGPAVLHRLAAGVIALVCGLDCANPIAQMLSNDQDGVRDALSGAPDGAFGGAPDGAFGGAGAKPDYEWLAASIEKDGQVALASLLGAEIAATRSKGDPVEALLRLAGEAPGAAADALTRILAELASRSPRAAAQLRRAIDRCAIAGIESTQVMPILAGLADTLKEQDPSITLREMATRLDDLR